MDDPDDPSWSWPHWKFGLERNDLFTKLHDQYNTVTQAIQDPEAFHHDVYEISNQATSTNDFHRRLQDRKEQRLRELNESLESAAFEIIANPELIGTDQWQHAVQLFRTKSLDSLVRYFASYLPKDHEWYQPARSVSGSETNSSVDSIANSHSSIFDDGPIMTDEPFEMDLEAPYDAYKKALLPPTPRSMTTCSESSAASPMDLPHHDFDLNTYTPPRTLSYSESEPDLHDEEVSQQPCDLESPVTSMSVASEVDAKIVDKVITPTTNAEAKQMKPASLSSVAEATESETPTPKPERQAASFFEPRQSLPHRRHRSTSPSRPLPLSRCEAEALDSFRDPRGAGSLHSPRQRRMECVAVRRSIRNRAIPSSGVRKASPDGRSTRLRGRAQGRL